MRIKKACNIFVPGPHTGNNWSKARRQERAECGLIKACYKRKKKISGRRISEGLSIVLHIFFSRGFGRNPLLLVQNLLLLSFLVKEFLILFRYWKLVFCRGLGEGMLIGLLLFPWLWEAQISDTRGHEEKLAIIDGDGMCSGFLQTEAGSFLPLDAGL